MSKKSEENTSQSTQNKRKLLDHRSTGTSREDTTQPKQVRKMPENIADYIDFTSPILKHLIEIEKKFWYSEINGAFKLPRTGSLDDSEASIQSLKAVTKYDLLEQNRGRQKMGRISSQRHCKTVDSRSKKRLKKRVRSRERSFNQSNFDTSAESNKKLRSTATRSNHTMNKSKSYLKMKQKKYDQETGMKLHRSPRRVKKRSPSAKMFKQQSHSRGYKTHHHQKNNSRSKNREKSPHKSHTRNDSRVRKSEARDTNVTRLPSRRRLRKSATNKYQTYDNRIGPVKMSRSKIMKSYLRKDISRNSKYFLEKSKIENGKSFLKRFKDVFSKKRQDLSKRKSHTSTHKKTNSKKRPMIASSTSKLLHKLKNIPQMPKTTKNNYSSQHAKQTLFSRIKSDFKGKPNYISKFHQNYLYNSKDLDDLKNLRPKSNSKSRQKKIHIPRNSKSRLKKQFSTYSNYPKPQRNASAVKSKSRERSRKRGGSKRHVGRSMDLKRSNLYNKSIDQLKQEVLDRKRVSDRLKIAEIEKKIFTSTFKHRILNKIFSKGRSAYRTKDGQGIGC